MVSRVIRAKGALEFAAVAAAMRASHTNVRFLFVGAADEDSPDRLEDLRRRAIARRYHEAFASLPTVQVPHDSPASQHAWHLYMLRLDLEQLRIDRARFIEELKERQIGASVHFIPLHVHPYYRDKYGYQPDDYPVAYQEYQREVSLPIYSKMTDADVVRVVEAVTEILAKNRR